MPIAPQPAPAAEENAAGTDETYADLLRLPALLAAARADADEPHMALFLVPHQVCELAFALIQRRLDDAGAALAERDGRTAAEMVRPLPALMRTVHAQFDVLHAMAPTAFATVRSAVGSASGIQSAQWRQIEYTCGLRERRHLATPGFTDRERARLLDQLGRPSLARQVFEFAAEVRTREDAGLVKVIRADLFAFEGVVQRWRRAHVGIAARFIGRSPGTAGTSGEAYLRSRANGLLFPALSELSTDALGAM
ncbi:tryptophan 2,3-dioxygenase family protein [Streptomyces niveus]|uniref:tryptophan 2,3-dioxygenase family protein n=1 Tax=Streptomyces niveus TaxID=193462 RepID=UPI0036BCCD76